VTHGGARVETQTSGMWIRGYLVYRATGNIPAIMVDVTSSQLEAFALSLER